MREHPHPNDPVTFLPLRCELAARHGEILVVILPDDARQLLLRNIARHLGGIYLRCRAMRSSRQFLEFLAGGLGCGAERDPYELWETVLTSAKRDPRVIVLDDAEQVTGAGLAVVLDLHKDEEHVGREVTFILGSGKRRLLERVETVDSAGSFISHCGFYIPGCKPTRKLAELREAMASWGSPTPIPFPAVTND